MDCKKEWDKCIMKSTKSYDLSPRKLEECKQRFKSCQYGGTTQPAQDSQTSAAGWENFKASTAGLDRK